MERRIVLMCRLREALGDGVGNIHLCNSLDAFPFGEIVTLGTVLEKEGIIR